MFLMRLGDVTKTFLRQIMYFMEKCINFDEDVWILKVWAFFQFEDVYFSS